MALTMNSISDFVGLSGLEVGMTCEVYFLQQKTEDLLKIHLRLGLVNFLL